MASVQRKWAIRLGVPLALLGGALWLGGQWQAAQQAAQARDLGCPSTCCGPPNMCKSYYYSTEFRQDTEDVYRRTLDALALQPGQRVADVGAGWGGVTLKAAPIVGSQGKVFATDLDRWRLAEIQRRATAAQLGQIETVAVSDPWQTGLEQQPPKSLNALVFLNSVNFKTEQERAQIVAYLQRWRALLAPGATVIYHTDWLDRWLLREAEVRALFAEAGFGQAQALALPERFTGATCYCPQAVGGQAATPVRVEVGYLLRWRV